MNIIYDNVRKLFNNHVLKCQNTLKKELNQENKERLKQIDLKLVHSYRVTDNMKNLFQELQFSEDYIDLAKSIGLLHDIGRFRQMVETGTYSDYASFEKKDGINDHGDYGTFILFKEKLINESDISRCYYGILYNSIKYHGKPELPTMFNYYLDDIEPYNKIELKSFLSSISNQDSFYLKLLSLYVRAIRDTDKIDIFYQNLTDEFPVIRTHFNYSPRGESLDYIANYWGITKQEIMEYNQLINDEVSNKKLIKIPVANIEPSKFTIPQFFINLFFEGKIPPVKEIVHHRWYTFITGTVIRLNFLRDINFVPTLITLKKQQILNKIYEKYPDKYKPLVKTIFEYTEEVLLNKTIHENEGKIYIKKMVDI